MKVLLVIAVSGILLISLYTLPTGTSVDISATKQEGTELLINPTLENNASGWDRGSWRFISKSWAPSTWTDEEGKVTMDLSGYDRSFYCISLAQHPNQPIYDKQHQYIVTWKGKMNNGDTLPTGCLGMGVNFWLDVMQNNQLVETLELYVFFYQKGFYTIPVGSWKDYGYRGSYWYETIVDAPNEDTWRFFYFHPFQLKFGETTEYTFSLDKCLDIVRQNAGEQYKNADYFILTSIDPVMEMFMAEGSFTVETLSLRRVN